jgi:hypothetical protein
LEKCIRKREISEKNSLPSDIMEKARKKEEEKTWRSD